MAWEVVKNYSFGFNTTNKKFWLYFTLENATSTTQLFLTPTQFSALATLFSASTGVSYETTQHYFASTPKTF
ncbi:MAG: hypothetical protein KGL71_11140 [Xanthomonadaceae bacterium]|nr:hypothetical protein [Xanthomonadaceae bacterium]